MKTTRQRGSQLTVNIRAVCLDLTIKRLKDLKPKGETLVALTMWLPGLWLA